MTSSTVSQPTSQPDSISDKLWGWGLRGLALLGHLLPHGMTVKRVAQRMAIIALMVWLTFNPFGWSYSHWVVRWYHHLASGVPTYDNDVWIRFGMFVGVILFGGVVYYYYLLHGTCRWRGIGLRGVFLYRILPLIILSAIFWTPQYGVMSWTNYWVELIFPSTPWYQPWHLSRAGKFELALFAFVTVGVVIAYHYVTKKSWQGLGSSKLGVFLALCTLGSIVGIFMALGLFPHTMKYVIAFVEIAIGAGMGFCYSLTYVDRQLSGTVTSSVTVQEDDATHREAGHVAQEEPDHHHH